MRQIVLEEILDTLEDDEQRNIDVVKPYFFTPQPAIQRLKLEPRTEQYGLVFDKHVLDYNTFMLYPYGYNQNLTWSTWRVWTF